MYNFKKLALVSAMSGAFVAPLALALDSVPDLDVTNAVTIAEELVEGASVVDLPATATTVDITLGAGAGDIDGFAVNQGSVFTVTFSLSNATFDSNLSVIDLDYSGAVGEVSISLISGGTSGENQVVYQVEAVQDISDDEVLSLNLPELSLSSDTNVTAAASVTVNNSSGIDDVEEGTVGVTSNAVITFASGVDTATNDGANQAFIDVTDRDDLSDNGAATDVLEADVTGLTAGVDALFIGDFAVTIIDDGAVTDEDGLTFDIDGGDSGEGVFTVSVTGGSIDDDDIVFVDFDMDGAYDAGEELGISGGVATEDYDSEDWLADGYLGDTSVPTAAPVIPVYLARESTIDLSPSTYTVTIDYSVDGLTESESESAEGSTKFDGLSIRDIFGNFPLAGQDIGNIRVISTTDLAGTDNSVFLQIYDRSGTDWGFVELTETIAAGGTVTYQADDVLAALGLTTWDGATNGNKVTVEVWTSDMAIVLPLISRGGVLTNMSQSTLDLDTDDGADDLGDFID